MKENLIDPGSTKENRQMFPEDWAMSLGDLCHYLMIIVVELKRYRLYRVRCLFYICLSSLAKCMVYQENCWFFASTLQQFLGASRESTFVEGCLKRPKWASRLRCKLQQKINQLYRLDLPPFSVRSVLSLHSHCIIREFLQLTEVIEHHRLAVTRHGGALETDNAGLMDVSIVLVRALCCGIMRLC